MTLKVSMLHTGCHSCEKSKRRKGIFLEICTFLKLCLSSLEQLVETTTIGLVVQEESTIKEMKENGTEDKCEEKKFLKFIYIRALYFVT